MRISGKTARSIADSIERQLTSGAPAKALPSVRVTASRLHVSPATVAAAYKLLQDRGLVAGHRRRGTRVVAPDQLPAPRTAEPPPAGVVDLSTGLPDPLLLPSDAAFGSSDAAAGHAPIDPRLMAFAAADFQEDQVPALEIVVAAGALDAIERILWEHLRAGDSVGVEDPSTPEIRELVAASGFVPVAVAVDADGPVPDAVASACAAGCRALIVTPRAQNPTGGALSAPRAAELRSIARRWRHVLLIENDDAAPIAGVGFESLRTEATARWAVIRSTSTFLGPDLRLALVAGDALTIGRVRRRQALGARWVSRIIQRLVLDAWSNPAGARRLARAAEIYAHRRGAAIAALADCGFTSTARSGFNLWIPVREEAAVVVALRTRGWMVSAGEPFRMRSGPAIRITTSALEAASAHRFAADLADVHPG